MNVEERLQELLDKQQVSELLLAFTGALDAKDWEAYGATFTPDAQSSTRSDAAAMR